MSTPASAAFIDRAELETKVKQIYRAVAQNPAGHYHFPMGRSLAEGLGYPPALFDLIPAGAIESFAGVGYNFDLADLIQGEEVLDLGSGSGMDAFVAALAVGPGGRVVGLDMAEEQNAKAESLRKQAHFPQVTFTQGHIEELPFRDASFDCVISNGVINLSSDKSAVFREAARVLRPGGRLAITDIVTEKQLTPQIVCNADLWAACIGGAAQTDTYQQAITDSGFVLEQMRRNPYEFLSDSARAAAVKYGVMSVSFLARARRTPGAVDRADAARRRTLPGRIQRHQTARHKDGGPGSGLTYADADNGQPVGDRAGSGPYCAIGRWWPPWR